MHESQSTRYKVNGGQVAVVTNFLTINEADAYSIFIDTVPIERKSNFGNLAKHMSFAFGQYEYIYSTGRGTACHKARPIPSALQQLAIRAAKALNRPDDYFNHILINRFNCTGIGSHTDDEPLYKDKNGDVGAVAVISIGSTMEPHVIGGKSMLAPSLSLVEMSSGSIYHKVGRANGIRYSITFRRVPN